MSTIAIRQKLHHYIETAKDKKVKAIFAMVEDDMEEGSIVWTDEFITELNQRAVDFEKGKVKGRTWEEVKKRARQLSKSK
jgi:putative addiction module component (TIGR02574 family)